MMNLQRHINIENRASVLIEYGMLLLIIFLVFFGMRTYILRAFSGYWRQMADTFGAGKQYCPNTGVWHSVGYTFTPNTDVCGNSAYPTYQTTCSEELNSIEGKPCCGGAVCQICGDYSFSSDILFKFECQSSQ